MTISAKTTRVLFNCDGVTTVFPIGIQAYNAVDFEVILTAPAGSGGAQTVLVLNSAYSMAQSGTMNPQQWTLTTLGAIPYAAGYTLQVILRPVQTQLTQYVQGQAFPSAAVQANVDRLTEMVLALQDQVNRALFAPDGDVAPGMALPPAGARALMYQAYDANGNSLLTAALPGTANTAASLGPLMNPRTPAEIAAGVFPLTANQIFAAGNVYRYGAVGGGAADDSAAFATAALVSGTHPMLIPEIAGGYKIVTPFVLPANASMIGLGRPLLFATVNGTGIVSATGVGGEITIQGILFAGTSSSTVPLTGFGGFAAANSGLLTVSNCSDVRVLDCEFATFYNGLTIQGCTRAWVHRGRVSAFQFIGVNVAWTGYFEIEFNDIGPCTQAAGVVAYGVSCTGNSAGGQPNNRSSVSFNRIHDIPSWDAIGSHDFDGLRIIGNDCRNVRHGIDLGHLLNTNICQNFTIANNYIEGTTTDTWGGAAAEIGAILVEGFDATHRVLGGTITGNTVRGFFNAAGMVGGGFGAGCICVANADDVNVTGNAVTGCGTAATPQATGIYLSGTCNRLSITGNSLQGGAFNRGGIRTNALTFDVLTIVGNSGIYTTNTTNHVAVLSSTGGLLNVNSNPTNSVLPYLESATATTGTSNATLAGSGNAATAVTNGSTIPTAFGLVRCTVAGASTGNILTAGIAPGQECTVFNNSGANSITMAAAGASNVADGVGCIIAANTYKRFIWNADTNLWYHS